MTIYLNIICLIFVQLSNYLSPLLVLPHLSHTLGVEGFGIIMVSMSLCSLTLILTDYGFGLSASYWIAKNRDIKKNVSNYLGAVFLIKTLIVLFLWGCLFFYYIYGNGILHKKNMIIPLIGLVALSQSYQPIWFFQGIEKMKNITLSMVVSKLAYVFLVFCFVKKAGEEDYVLICMVISNILATLIGIISIYKEGYYIARPSLFMIKNVLAQGSDFFVSRIAVGIYTSASTFIVGSVAGVHQAALYSSAEKLYQAGQSLTSPVSQALYPYVTRTGDKKFLLKFILISFFPLMVGCSVCAYYASEILTIFYGVEFVLAEKTLQIFLFCSVVTFISVNFGYPAFAAIGKVKIANQTVIVGGGLQLIMLGGLFYFNNVTASNVVMSVLITEIAVLLLRLMFFIRLSN